MKIVEVKRKIISLIRNREYTKAIKLFYKYFNENNPAEIEFIKNVYVEFDRLDLPKDNYELLKQIKSWYPDNNEFDLIFDNATQTYVSKLILQANSIRFQRIDKQKRLEESLRRTDSLTRSKMEVENSKQLNALNEQSIELYKAAIKLSPKNLIAYKGWLDCCYISKNLEEAERLQRKILAIEEEENQSDLLKKEEEEKEKKRKKELAQINYYPTYEKYLKEQKYEELIKEVDELYKNEAFQPELLLLKAKALAYLKRFHDSQKALFLAECLYPDFNLYKQTIEEINNIKYKLYVKAANVYLKKGLDLGFPIGIEYFTKAKYCFYKALDIDSSELDVLDQTYTALKYLGHTSEALDIKAQIYNIDTHYILSYDSKYNKTMCFIATYAFSNQPKIVDEFRWFRREYLLNTIFGRRLNCLYVKLSSKVTRSLINNNFFKYIFRIILYFPLIIIRFLKYFTSQEKR